MEYETEQREKTDENRWEQQQKANREEDELFQESPNMKCRNIRNDGMPNESRRRREHPTMSERRKHPAIMVKEAIWEDRNIRKLPNVKAKHPELMEQETNREEDGKCRKCPKMEDRNIR